MYTAHWVADLTPDQEHLGDFMGQILNELDFNHMYWYMKSTTKIASKPFKWLC